MNDSGQFSNTDFIPRLFLSAVAKKITGSHWSGNKFFNLNDKEGN